MGDPLNAHYYFVEQFGHFEQSFKKTDETLSCIKNTPKITTAFKFRESQKRMKYKQLVIKQLVYHSHMMFRYTRSFFKKNRKDKHEEEERKTKIKIFRKKNSSPIFVTAIFL